MNRNDFYKELFEKYALDEEKIRRNALKAAKTPAWKRAVSNHWKTAVGAAAAVAVTVGAVTYIAGQTPVIDIVSSETLLSASQRLQDAEQDYMNSASEDESMTPIYVSFMENMCYSDMSVALSAVPDSDDINIETLYLSDGTRIAGKNEIESYAETGAADKRIAGVKLNAPARSLRDLWDLSCVNIAELGSAKLNDDTFAPIGDDDPLRGDSDTAVTTSAAKETTAVTTSFSFVTEKSVTETSAAITETQSETPELSEDPELADPDNIGEDENGDTTVPAETDEPDIVEEVTEEPEEAETSASETSESTEAPQTVSEEISASVTEITDTPDIGLMTQIYQLNVENSLDTILVGDYAVVLTRNSVYCYTIGGLVNPQPKVCEVTNPKIAHADRDNVIISGCGQDGLRDVIVVLDTATGAVYSTDVKPSIGESEIGTVYAASAEGRYFLKTVSASSTYIYEITLNAETGVQFRPLFDYAGAVSLAGYRNNRLWFTAADENMKYSLYSFDCRLGALRTDYTFDGECRVRRSPSFESFIISVNGTGESSGATFVYDVSTGSLCTNEQIHSDAAIAVKYGKIFIGMDGKNYILSADGLTDTAERVDYTGKPYTGYVVYSSDAEKVVISEKLKWD